MLYFPLNEVRHALVENFRSSKDSSNVQVPESLASVCKHSLCTQIEVYDQRSQRETMKHALHYFHQSAVSAIVDDIPTTSHNAENADSSSKEHGLPTPQEILRFFLPIRDLDLSIFLLGKSFKIHFIWSDVLLGVATKKEGKPKQYYFRLAIRSGRKGSQSDLPTRHQL